MKKSFVCLLLAVVMIFTSAQGMAFGIAKSIPEKDTPVAEIANDDYVPYNYENRNNDEAAIDSLTSEIESVGGYVEKYNSEEEYQRSQKSAASSSVTDYSLTESEIEPVKQTVTVMTTPTGSKEHGNYVESEPVANAIVRLDGVPRYTDRNGQIKATLNREYVELYVEKEGYNPYIEIIEVTGEEKIVNLKKPSDNIDIYAVMMEYEGEYFNLLSQPCYINKNVNDSYCELNVFCNIQVDEYYFLVNGELELFSLDGKFDFFDYSNYNENDKFSVMVECNGIESEIIPVNLKITAPSVSENDFWDGINNGQGDKLEDDMLGEVGNINTSAFMESIIKFFMKYYELINKGSKSFDVGGDNTISFEYFYNPHTGILELSIGYTHTFSDPNLVKAEKQVKESRKNDKIKAYKEKAKEVAQAKKELRKLKKEVAQQDDKSDANKKAYIKRKTEEIENLKTKYEDSQQKDADIKKEIVRQERNYKANLKGYENRAKKRHDKIAEATRAVNQGKSSLKNLASKLNDSYIRPATLKPKGFLKSNGIEIDVDVSFIGKISVNILNPKDLDAELTIGFELKASTTFGFSIWVIPCFLTIETSCGVEANIQFVDDGKFMSIKEIIKKIYLQFNLGVGVEVGAGIKNLASISGYGEFEYENSPVSNQINIEVGIKAQLLFYEKKWSHKEVIELKSKDEGDDTYILPRTFAYNLNRSDDFDEKVVSAHILQNTEPQMVQIDNKLFMIWLDDSSTRDDYNRTVLMYSVFEDGKWSTAKSVLDDGKADFYPSLLASDNGLYIVWQKSSRIFNSEDSVSDMLQAGEIYFAEIDLNNLNVKKAVRLTENNRMDAAPVFAVDSNASENDLYVIWQSNSNNDIMCTTGVNSIYYRHLKNGVWDDEVKLYESTSMLSSITSAVAEGELNVAMVSADISADGAINSGKLTVINSSADTVFTSDNKIRAEYVLVGGKPALVTFNGTILELSYSDYKFEKFLDCSEYNILPNYRITDSKDYISVFYNGLSNGSRQVYVAIYDKLNSNWIQNVVLTDEQDKVNNAIGFVNGKGDVNFVYNLGNEEYESLCFVSKSLSTDFDIEEYFTDDVISENNDLTLNIVIKNTGDLPINEFTVSAFDQDVNVILTSPLMSGTQTVLKVDFKAIKLNAVGYEEVTVNSSNSISRSFNLNTSFADVSLSVENIINCDKQNFIVNIKNNGMQTSGILSCYINGELYLTKEFALLTDSDIIEAVTFEEIKEGDCIYFIIEPASEDAAYLDNEAWLFSVKDEYKVIANFNGYGDIMQNAKNLIWV